MNARLAVRVRERGRKPCSRVLSCKVNAASTLRLTTSCTAQSSQRGFRIAPHRVLRLYCGSCSRISCPLAVRYAKEFDPKVSFHYRGLLMNIEWHTGVK